MGVPEQEPPARPARPHRADRLDRYRRIERDDRRAPIAVSGDLAIDRAAAIETHWWDRLLDEGDVGLKVGAQVIPCRPTRIHGMSGWRQWLRFQVTSRIGSMRGEESAPGYIVPSGSVMGRGYQSCEPTLTACRDTLAVTLLGF